jgi:hypothetical protein
MQQPLFGVSQKYPGPSDAQSALVRQSGTSQVDGICPHCTSPSALRMHRQSSAAEQ